MSKSYDLSTSTKWANLADGEHTVKIKAKGTGFGTSSFSNEVTVTKGATGETWVLKDSLFGASSINVSVNFISNGITYNKLVCVSTRSYTYIDYQSTRVYLFDLETGETPGWSDQAYRTITFSTPPTGDLLTWLQANGTKQGGVTEHTLTCADDAIIITVNGSVVTSPYTLQPGDTIVLKRASSPWYSAIITAGDNTYDTDVTSPPITISNSDIFISRGETNNSPSLAMSGFTIDYTA